MHQDIKKSAHFLHVCLFCLLILLYRAGKGRGRDGGGGKGPNDRDLDFRRRVERYRKLSGMSPPRAFGRLPPKLYAECTKTVTPVPSMPMQKIFMTNENQEQLKELLRELQTQDFDEPSE